MVIAGHGTPFGNAFGITQDAEAMKKFADAIKNHPNYSSEKPVLLLSCEAAGDTGSPHIPNLADKLSQLLPNPITGSDSPVNISRPPDWSWWGSDGTYTIPPLGMWKTYSGGTAVSASMNLSLGGGIMWSSKK